MLIIGITGGVCAGKSSFVQYLYKKYNTIALRTDDISKQIMFNDENVKQQIKDIFKNFDILTENKEIDKVKMSICMFQHENLRLAINELMHPLVINYVIEQIEKHKNNKNIDIIVIESALLIESEMYKLCDETWYIYTSEEERRERLKTNRQYSDEKITNIYKTQLLENQFKQYAIMTIDNSGIYGNTFYLIDKRIKEKYPNILKKDTSNIIDVLSLNIEN